MNRRWWLRVGLIAVASGVMLDGLWLERNWLQVKHIELNQNPDLRIVHISDLHFNGDGDYLQKILEIINGLAPQIICFTGDLTEKNKYLQPALEFMADMPCPVYAVPGNHDYEFEVSFSSLHKYFQKTGGAFLLDECRQLPDNRGLICGASDITPVYPEKKQAKNIFLCHYPVIADRLEPGFYDLILAGHSHGGQVCLPLIGPLWLPNRVNDYVSGLYDTPGGPLYVNKGLGCNVLPIRILCRPEITLILI